MDTLETLKRRIDTATSLRDLVRTMKTLAAVSVRHYERSVAALTDYDRTIELGLRAVLRHAAPRRRSDDETAAAPVRSCSAPTRACAGPSTSRS